MIDAIGSSTMRIQAQAQSQAMPAQAMPARLERAGKAAKEFEAMFATQMLSPMWETVPVDEETGGGHGEEVFRTMMLQEYGKIVAAGDSLGLASTIKQQMLQHQEIAS
ncbi:MAG: rod-binding protein [Alphaproteobacteria bacterium]